MPLLCSICMSDEHDCLHTCEKLITKCNHFFHKTCFYRVKMTNNYIQCPNCRALIHVIYESTHYNFSEIPQEIKNIFQIITTIVREVPCTEYTITGGFALYVREILCRKKITWNYKDIDILYHGKEIFPKSKSRIVNDLLIKMERKESNFTNTAIQSASECSTFDMKQSFVGVGQLIVPTIAKFNLHHVKINVPFYNVVSNFDLDCCKVFINFDNDGITIFTSPSWFLDGAKENANPVRVNKYRLRGYKCLM